jgi:hypothetical protein
MPHSKSYDSDQPEGKDQVESKSGTFSRRKLLAGAAGLAAATAVGGVAAGQTTTPTPTGRSLGGPATELGERSSHELLQRLPGGAVVGGPVMLQRRWPIWMASSRRRISSSRSTTKRAPTLIRQSTS